MSGGDRDGHVNDFDGIKPSHVAAAMWRGIFPLIGTLGRAEIEMAAGLMVLAMVDDGDEWGPVALSQIGASMKKAGQEGGCMAHLVTNPFMPRPDFRGLAMAGAAEFLGDPDDSPPPPIVFTSRGIALLCKVAKGAGA